MVNNNSLGSNMTQDESNTNYPFTLQASRREPHADWLPAPGENGPAEDILPRGAPRDTSSGFGHLIWLLASAN